MRTQSNSWQRKSETKNAMIDGPFSHCEAAVWNFLLFWCLGAPGADLTTIEHWLGDSFSQADIYISIASLMERGAIQRDKDGYYPLVNGSPYRNAGTSWGDILAMAVDPDRTLH
jgi:hypothetical protein